MDTLRKLLIIVALLLAGLFIFATALFASRTPAQASNAPASQLPAQLRAPIDPKPPVITATPTLTDMVTERMNALLVQPSLTSGLSPLPPGTSLESVKAETDVVTVVLNLPESVLYNPDVAVDSDGINVAVVQSLQD